jgi:hypothetical protein
MVKHDVGRWVVVRAASFIEIFYEKKGKISRGKMWRERDLANCSSLHRRRSIEKLGGKESNTRRDLWLQIGEFFFSFRESLTMTTCVSRFCTRQHSLFFIFIPFHLVTFYFSQRQGDLLFPSDSHVHLQVVLTYGKEKEKMITQSLGYNNNGHIVPLWISRLFSLHYRRVYTLNVYTVTSDFVLFFFEILSAGSIETESPRVSK